MIQQNIYSLNSHKLKGKYKCFWMSTCTIWHRSIGQIWFKSLKDLLTRYSILFCKLFAHFCLGCSEPLDILHVQEFGQLFGAVQFYLHILLVPLLHDKLVAFCMLPFPCKWRKKTINIWILKTRYLFPCVFELLEA